ncbi:2-succinyl-5-enolpyruvyl-6-hydroxy-3-cyclohexene-1-carboxylic-acid synthase [Nocardioides pacificus]
MSAPEDAAVNAAVNAATRLARGVVTALVDAGVTEVVLSPGSRNAPLAFAVYDAARAGGLRLHTRVDERTAGFLALGLTKVGARAAVMCTSGTAVANLHPAVLEAAHAGLPLVVVTADRPASLRGTGASQTTDQVRIFGDAAVFHDLAEGEVPSLAAEGPVHLNVQLTPPLVPDGVWEGAPIGQRLQVADGNRRRLVPNGTGSGAHHLPLGPRTVVVAGDDAGPPPRILAQRAGWPLFAEPTSGCRTGDNALRAYRLLLDSELAGRIERVVVAGHPTLSRPITRLLEQADIEVVSLRARGSWATRPFPVDSEHDRLEVDESDDTGWLDEWKTADRAVSREVDRLLAAEEGVTPHEVAAAVSRAVPPKGMLFVGASSPIRDLDLMARPTTVGERRKVIANRGLAGIDGTISSAIGAALGRPHGTRSLALMGDVTFVHDSTGLVIGPDEERPDLTIVVVNDDGGSIFTMLEQGASTYADSFDRLFGTPHGVDLASLCAATRTPHWRVDSVAELEHALASPNGGIEVVEVVVRRDNRRELDARIRAL